MAEPEQLNKEPKTETVYTEEDLKDLRAAVETAEMQMWEKDQYYKLRRGVIDWRAMRSKRSIKWWVVAGFLTLVGALAVVYHDQMVVWVTPYAMQLKTVEIDGTPVGMALPIILITVLSIPPLGGQEFVILLSGLVWGLGIGFGLAAAGTVVGEVLNWFIYKRFFPGLAQKRTLLFLVLQKGGFWLCLATRLTYIPTHATTTIYAVCGFDFYRFMAAMVLSLGKQLLTVYAGVVIGKVQPTQRDKIISWCSAGGSVLATVGVMVWIYLLMRTKRHERVAKLREIMIRREVLPEPYPGT